MRTSKARTGLRARLACHRRWSVYGKQLPSYTRGGSRMRESRPYGSVRGARDETRVPTATGERETPRVHHAAGCSGRVAARGARAAAGQNLADGVYCARTGRNLIVERRYAGDRTERIQEFAAEMVRLKADICMEDSQCPHS